MNNYLAKVFFGLMGGVVFMSGFAVADDIGEAPPPYRITHPYTAGDKNTVYVYFKYDCPFCRSYHEELAEWAKTLPPRFSFKFIPVIEAGVDGKASQKSIVGFYAHESSVMVSGSENNEQLQSFSQKAYSIEQDNGDSGFKDRQAWISAVNSSGMNGDKFITDWGVLTKTNLLLESIKRQDNYMPKSTPTLIACGRYAITPDNTGGSEVLFMRLANAVVSKCMSEDGD